MRILKQAASRDRIDSHRHRVCRSVLGFTAALFVFWTFIPGAAASEDTMSAREAMQRKDVGVAVITVTDPRSEGLVAELPTRIPRLTDDMPTRITRQPLIVETQTQPENAIATAER